jgi:hypothetical protein
LRGCGLPGRCRLFLRGKTASNTSAPGEHLLASIGATEDARPYQFLERSAFGNARRVRTGYRFGGAFRLVSFSRPRH